MFVEGTNGPKIACNFVIPRSDSEIVIPKYELLLVIYDGLFGIPKGESVVQRDQKSHLIRYHVLFEHSLRIGCQTRTILSFH